MIATCDIPKPIIPYNVNFYSNDLIQILNFSTKDFGVNIIDPNVKIVSLYYNPVSKVVSEPVSNSIDCKLDSLLTKCGVKNWDNENAEPISKRAVSNAKKFVLDIENLSLPEVVPFPNSDVGFSWEKEDNTLDVIFKQNDQVIYVKVQNNKISSGFFNIDDIKVVKSIVEDFGLNDEF